MMERLRRWTAHYGNVGDVRGRGLMIGVELVTDQSSRTPAGELRDRVVSAAFERGLLILGCGENTIRLCPPLILTQAEADAGLDMLEASLRDVTAGLLA